MGKKYIIELEEEPFVVDNSIPYDGDDEELYRVKGFKSLVFDQSGLDKLVPIEQVRPSWLDEWYQKGLDDAFNTMTVAWNACEEYRNEMFGTTKFDVVLGQRERAVQRLRKYEERKQKEDAEIRVGDEVLSSYGSKGIITRINQGIGFVYIMWSDGSSSEMDTDWLKNAKKTGRHFDEIETVLSKMRGEDDA